MRRDLHNEEFEYYLRETVDEFRMIPRERVWFSLYNNLHPGSKWPSATVALLLLFGILSVGILNNNRINSIHANKNAALVKAEKRSAAGLLSAEMAEKEIAKINAGSNTGSTVMLASNDITAIANTPSNEANANSAIEAAGKAVIKISPSNQAISNLQAPAAAKVNWQTVNAEVTGIAESATPQLSNKKPLAFTDVEEVDEAANDFQQSAFVKQLQKIVNNADVTYYISPSAGFRKINNKQGESMLARDNVSSSFISLPNISTAEQFNQSTAINLEAGVAVGVKLNENIKTLAGVQLNFTDYNIHAVKLDHPIESALLVRSSSGADMLSARSAIYANPDDNLANVQLQNRSFQVSVPLGVEVKLAEFKRISWYASTTVQPTKILGANNYMLSYDTKHYIEDDSYLRSWNLNVGAETYLGYRLNNGLQLNLGPQYRQQLFSTYNDNYRIQEKLYNIGIKLGLTKKF